MRHWWVNQNQTFRHELKGMYLWSPKRKTNNARNPYYDFMREVAPGDIVFSFSDTRIRALGIAASHAYEAPKPKEFGTAGAYWDKIGWRVDVQFIELNNQIRPVEHMDLLRSLLPDKYAPLRPNGAGLQNLYLTALPERFATALIGLIGQEARKLIVDQPRLNEVQPLPGVGLAQWEEHELANVHSDRAIPETEREAIVLARRGQGLFKQLVMEREQKCRITGVDRVEHLRASHCKPWRDATNQERLDGENGLLLTPNADHLFDRGFIGFENNGTLLISPVAHAISLERLGIDPKRKTNVGSFSEGQKRYLDYHRENVLLASKYLGHT